MPSAACTVGFMAGHLFLLAPNNWLVAGRGVGTEGREGPGGGWGGGVSGVEPLGIQGGLQVSVAAAGYRRHLRQAPNGWT